MGNNPLNEKIIAGIDEAGAGPLCGPVFAACVVFNCEISGEKISSQLTDSKKISESKREKIFDAIMEMENMGKILFGIGQVGAEEIDRINIRNARKLSMVLAYGDMISKYKIKPTLVKVDGNFVPELEAEAEFIIGGDGLVAEISCASIVAKVSRDRLMRKIHDDFPEYGWLKNKGYGTKEHTAAIKKHGLSPHHRRSFCTGIFGLFD